MTKLQVRLLSSFNGPMLTVCDEEGNALPNQERVELFNSVKDVPKVTVTFTIDGEDVRLIGNTNGSPHG